MSCGCMCSSGVRVADPIPAKKAGALTEGREWAPRHGDSITDESISELERAAIGVFAESGPQNPRSAIGRFSVFTAQRHYKDTLAAIGYAVLRDVAKELGLPLDVLASFCEAVDRNMPDNDYHNKLHVADVVQLMFLQTSESGPLHELCKDPKIKLAALLAALVHDLRHPGLSNAYLRATNHVLVEKFGPDGTAERMHFATFKEFIQDPALDFLKPLGAKKRSHIINVVEKVVLSTDMAHHADYLNMEEPTNPEAFLLYRLGFAMKVSDLSHCLRAFKVHSRFVEMLKKEFYAQGDKEEELGLPVSFGMKSGESPKEIAQGQMDFLSVFIEPLLNRYALISSAPLIKQLQSSLTRNIQSWSLMALDAARPEYMDGRMMIKRSDQVEYERQISVGSDERSMKLVKLARMYSIQSVSDAASDVFESVKVTVHGSLQGLQLRRPTKDLLTLGLNAIASGFSDDFDYEYMLEKSGI